MLNSVASRFTEKKKKDEKFAPISNVLTLLTIIFFKRSAIALKVEEQPQVQFNQYLFFILYVCYHFVESNFIIELRSSPIDK